MLTTLTKAQDRMRAISTRLSSLEAERASLAAELEQLKITQDTAREKSIVHPSSQITDNNIALFASLFKGREDVLPKRWDNQKTGKSGYSPACGNEWVKGICYKPQVKCSECMNQAFVRVSQDVIRRHICGDGHTVGVYPMLKDETCWLLAADFDKKEWLRDAVAFLKACRKRNVPASLERSRSGNGGHIWIFFSKPIPASEARKMGAALLTETMEQCP